MFYVPTTHRSFVRDESEKIVNSDKAATIIKNLIGDKIAEKEHFCIITLDGASQVKRCEVIHIGTVNQSLVHPREVFRPAIIDNAAGIIIAHNHPSGTLEASRADIQITQRLKEVAKLMGIDLLDHIILTKEGHYSFSEDGLL